MVLVIPKLPRKQTHFNHIKFLEFFRFHVSDDIQITLPYDIIPSGCTQSWTEFRYFLKL